jgi:hypothetical protein
VSFISMIPDGVRRAAVDLDGMAEKANARTESMFAPSQAAAAGNPGWLSGTAVHSCRAQWEGRLDQLADSARDMAQAMRSSSGDVSTLDQEAFDRFSEVLKNMAGPPG